ncbi:hypothetical protein BJX76DRAFT_360651 [Aspergillus varians]
MEHLPLPHGIKPFITAPYEPLPPPSSWYNKEGFLTFPSSRHWTETQLLGENSKANKTPTSFTNKGSNAEIEQFFQTWLFFRLAIDVLELGGVLTATEDFLKPQSATKARIVDTSGLPSVYRVVGSYQSYWLKRPWTHQEGFLPQAVWFQFTDRPAKINDLRSRLDEHQYSLQARGIHLGFPISANTRLVELYTFLAFVFKDKTNDRKWVLYKPLAAAMSERKTSQLADEIICLATINRMGMFLCELGRFNTGIIFNNYERLEERGYRWAPTSLLNLRTAQITYWGSDGHEEATPLFDYLREWKAVLCCRGTGVCYAIQCVESADTGRNIDGKWFIVQLPLNKVRWSAWKTYAMILSEIPKAVVASVDQRPANGVYPAEHQSTAAVWVQDSPPAWVDTVPARLLGRNTGGLVV